MCRNNDVIQKSRPNLNVLVIVPCDLQLALIRDSSSSKNINIDYDVCDG